MNIFKFEFKRQVKSLIIWSMICSFLVIVFMALFPSMNGIGMQDLVGNKMEAIPTAILDAFNIDMMMDFSKIKDFMGYCLQYIVIATGVYGAILGVSALNKEEKEGTIEFLYSKPISRSKIVTSKLASSALIILAFIIVLCIVTMISGILVKPEDIEMMTLITDIKTIYIGALLLGYTFMALGFLISVLTKSNINVTAISLGVFFSSFFMGVIGKLKDGLEWLIYLSPTDYFIPNRLFKEGFEGKYLITALVIMIVSIVATYTIYNKKDLG